MNIPNCPNNSKSTAICERSQLRLYGENEQSFLFTCLTCKLLWAVSKPKTKDRAKWENKVRKIQEATQIEREKTNRVYSFAKG
jgi:cytochrome c5